MQTIIINKNFIKETAKKKEEENDAFRSFMKNMDGDMLDKTVQQLNEIIAPQIDCTACGACCSHLMINVTVEECEKVSANLNINAATFKQQYIEESLQGKMIINTIPCHFLEEKKCTVYAERFEECREFPHLHKSNFKGRLFGTLVHYALCPIIFNVIEELKLKIGFKEVGFANRVND